MNVAIEREIFVGFILSCCVCATYHHLHRHLNTLSEYMVGLAKNNQLSWHHPSPTLNPISFGICSKLISIMTEVSNDEQYMTNIRQARIYGNGYILNFSLPEV